MVSAVNRHGPHHQGLAINGHTARQATRRWASKASTIHIDVGRGAGQAGLLSAATEVEDGWQLWRHLLGSISYMPWVASQLLKQRMGGQLLHKICTLHQGGSAHRRAPHQVALPQRAM